MYSAVCSKNRQCFSIVPLVTLKKLVTLSRNCLQKQQGRDRHIRSNAPHLVLSSLIAPNVARNHTCLHRTGVLHVVLVLQVLTSIAMTWTPFQT